MFILSVLSQAEDQTFKICSTSMSCNYFPCPVAGCKKFFRKRDYLNQHARFHSGNLDFECPQCEKRYKWRSSLHYHKMSVHSKYNYAPNPSIRKGHHSKYTRSTDPLATPRPIKAITFKSTTPPQSSLDRHSRQKETRTKIDPVVSALLSVKAFRTLPKITPIATESDPNGKHNKED